MEVPAAGRAIPNDSSAWLSLDDPPLFIPPRVPQALPSSDLSWPGAPKPVAVDGFRTFRRAVVRLAAFPLRQGGPDFRNMISLDNASHGSGGVDHPPGRRRIGGRCGHRACRPGPMTSEPTKLGVSWTPRAS